MHHQTQPELTGVTGIQDLSISSPSFQEGDYIPEKYTCDGKNINPPLYIGGIPEKTKCLAFILDDPDAPAGTWVHWIIWNIPVTHHYKENAAQGTQGLTDFQKNRYGGPCPPPGKPHRYFFKVYALNEFLELPVSAGKNELEKTMKDSIIAFGVLTGKYQRKKA